jgi:hypothetical protein
MYCIYPDDVKYHLAMTSLKLKKRIKVTIALVDEMYCKLHLPTVVSIMSLVSFVFDVFWHFRVKITPSNNPKQRPYG